MFLDSRQNEDMPYFFPCDLKYDIYPSFVSALKFETSEMTLGSPLEKLEARIVAWLI